MPAVWRPRAECFHCMDRAMSGVLVVSIPHTIQVFTVKTLHLRLFTQKSNRIIIILMIRRMVSRTPCGPLPQGKSALGRSVLPVDGTPSWNLWARIRVWRTDDDC